MKIDSDFFNLAKITGLQALKLLESFNPETNATYYCKTFTNELKSDLDKSIESLIIKNLQDTNIPILSEELGLINEQYKPSEYLWIIDPLDGTINFIRELGPCAISIALFKNNTPLFGVIVEFPSGNIYFGGKNYGSFVNYSKPIKVSNIENPNHSIICTGIPTRLKSLSRDQNILHTIKEKFSKIRMIGSAAISLTHVAKGGAECYFEKEIMLWDVAAGLSIIEGAGGFFKMRNGTFHHSKIVAAANRMQTCNLFI